MITFSSQMKEELTRIQPQGRESELALMSGLIKSAGTVYFARGAGVKILTELASVARLAHTILKSPLGLKPRLNSRLSSSFSKRNLYEVEADDALEALVEMGLIDRSESGYSFPDEIPTAYHGETFRYYIRGLFLGAGSVTTPEKGYHLEIVFKSPSFAQQVADRANRLFDVGAKLVARKNDTVFYIKESDKIVDFLNVVGAYQSLLAYENVRVMRYVRNNANRGVNCDTANIEKATEAANAQIEAIALLEAHGWLRRQSEKLIEIAELRKQNPLSSLTELGEMLDPPVTKSGVNHRMKKIQKLAEELRGKQNETVKK
ncbi:MAG: DNA-binding protein WhiA [Bacillota bacterium]|nr:DNA-binding protein WhiA [Bacillota bacterium]